MMIKRIFSLWFVFAFCMLPVTAFAIDYVTINNDNVNVYLKDSPFIENKRVMVSVRDLTACFDLIAQADWMGNQRTVTIDKDSVHLTIAVGEMKAYLDGKEVPIDQGAKVFQSITYLPLRFVSETFGKSVSWDAETRTVTITSSQTPTTSNTDPFYSKSVFTKDTFNPLSNKMVPVKARKNGGDEFAEFKNYKEFPTLLYENLTGFDPKAKEMKFSKYGGLVDKKYEATGFFRTQKIGDRWFMIDPEGYIFINSGLASVRPERNTDEGKAAFTEKFKDDEKLWAKETVKILKENGINSIGGFSNTPLLGPELGEDRLPYVCHPYFITPYSKEKNLTSPAYGHSNFFQNVMPVFDKGFVEYADKLAKEVAVPNDPYCLGYFSDNELPTYKLTLNNYLTLDGKSDAYKESYDAAWNWFRLRKGENATLENTTITKEDDADFRGYVYEQLAKVVTEAIKKYDPNHLIMGTRFYGGDKSAPKTLAAAGKYFDVISMNHYTSWDGGHDWIDQWSSWANDKPFIITEWYAMAMDTGHKNTSGAGWVVETQEDRAKFYESYALGLLQMKGCIGWQWFKYLDEGIGAGNKGLFRTDFTPYQPVLDTMKKINEQKYLLIEYFDSKK